jgi:hypothetical protein
MLGPSIFPAAGRRELTKPGRASAEEQIAVFRVIMLCSLGAEIV